MFSSCLAVHRTVYRRESARTSCDDASVDLGAQPAPLGEIGEDSRYRQRGGRLYASRLEQFVAEGCTMKMFRETRILKWTRKWQLRLKTGIRWEDSVGCWLLAVDCWLWQCSFGQQTDACLS